MKMRLRYVILILVCALFGSPLLIRLMRPIGNLVFNAMGSVIRPGRRNVTNPLGKKLIHQPPIIITAKGSWEDSAPAEVAVLNFEIEYRHKSKKTATETVIHDATQVRQLLESLSGPVSKADKPTLGHTGKIGKWSMSSLRTRESYHHSDRDAVKYAAEIGFTVQTDDLTAVTELATLFQQERHVSLESLEWRLTDRTVNSMLGEAQRGALNDAQRKAYVYAMEAADIGEYCVKVVEVHEGRLQVPSVRWDYEERSEAMLTLASSGGASTSRPSFSPGELVLRHEVDVKFVAENQWLRDCSPPPVLLRAAEMRDK